jgi:hypothetical protein
LLSTTSRKMVWLRLLCWFMSVEPTCLWASPPAIRANTWKSAEWVSIVS